MNRSRSPEHPAPVICDTWVGDLNSSSEDPLRVPSYGSGLAAGSTEGSAGMPVSYFELYKNRMKKLKEAGLRADVNLCDVTSASERQFSREDALSPNDFQDTSFEDFTG